jgi:peptide/nickel transport system permease protein
MAILVNFFVPRLIPGNPVQMKLAEYFRMGVQIGGQEFVEKYSKFFNLDQPLYMQFFSYLDSILHGNLGFSISYFPASVSDIVWRAFPWTMGLLVSTALVSFAGGILLGALMGWTKRGGSKLITAVYGLFLIWSRVPFYILGMFLIYLLAFALPIFPVGGGVGAGLNFGSIDYAISVLYYATLPALSILLVQIGGWALAERSLTVSILGEDYLLLAKAKGLRNRFIFMHYVVRNTLVPQMTDLSISIGRLASGSIITEIIFSYPGMGSLLYTSVMQLDYPTIQGVSLIVILCVVTAAYLIDIVYPLLDPTVGSK